MRNCLWALLRLFGTTSPFEERLVVKLHVSDTYDLWSSFYYRIDLFSVFNLLRVVKGRKNKKVKEKSKNKERA